MTSGRLMWSRFTSTVEQIIVAVLRLNALANVVREWRVSRKSRHQTRLWRVFAKLPVPPRPHTLIFRLTGGIVGSHLPLTQLRALLLTTTGRRTGKLRTTPVVYFRQGKCLVIVASDRGRGRYPEWYWNLQFNSQARIQVGRNRQSVYAKEARPEERCLLWPLLTEMLPLLALYQERTTRELPVLILHPMRKP